jgi:alpha-amylase
MKAQQKKTTVADTTLYSEEDFNHFKIKNRVIGDSFEFYYLDPAYKKNCGITDADFQQNAWKVKNCDLVGLPTLNRDQPKVNDIARNFVVSLLDFGVDGFFIDAAKHLEISDIKAVFGGLRTKRGEEPFLFFELPVVVTKTEQEPIDYQSYFKIGPITGHNFAGLMYSTFRHQANPNLNSLNYVPPDQWFKEASVSSRQRKIFLADIIKHGLDYYLLQMGSDNVLTMVSNHDTENLDVFKAVTAQQSLAIGNNNAYNLANAFMLAIPYGTPLVFSGYINPKNQFNPFPQTSVWVNKKNTCFAPHSLWSCQQRWPIIANMISFRSKTHEANQLCHVYAHGDQVGFGRCDQSAKVHGYFFINNTDQAFKGNLITGMTSGCYADILHNNNEICVDRNTTIRNLEVKPYDAIAFVKP